MWRLNVLLWWSSAYTRDNSLRLYDMKYELNYQDIHYIQAVFRIRDRVHVDLNRRTIPRWSKAVFNVTSVRPTDRRKVRMGDEFGTIHQVSSDNHC